MSPVPPEPGYESPERALRRQLCWLEEDLVSSLLQASPGPESPAAAAPFARGGTLRRFARNRTWWRRWRRTRASPLRAPARLRPSIALETRP